MRKLTLLAIALLAPAFAQAASLEEMLAAKGVINKGHDAGAAAGSKADVWYNDGVQVNSGAIGFTWKANAYVHSRYTFTDNDSGVDNTSSFNVERARLKISGTAMHEEFEYAMMTDMVGSQSDSGSSPTLLDAYIVWHACDMMSAKMGQFKSAVGRQNNTDESMLLFADRSAVSDMFTWNGTREQGLQLGINAMDKLALSAAIFNGNSTGEGQNLPGVDTKHKGVVAMRFAAMGDINSMMEGDIEHSEMGLDFGAAYSYGTNVDAATATETDDQTLSVDVNAKSNGLAFNGEFFWNDSEVDGADDSVSTNGFYAQVGYALNDSWEVAGRYGFVDCDNGASTLSSRGGAFSCSGNDDLNEIGASINHYFGWGRHLVGKFGWDLIDTNPADDAGDGVKTNRWMFQLEANV